jgi:S-adenosylmethionine decarboxylase
LLALCGNDIAVPRRGEKREGAMAAHRTQAPALPNLAPEIFRQRLLIEGHWTVDVDETAVRLYLIDLAAHLGLRTYGAPVVHAPASGEGRPENAGFDAFVPLIDSGISGYFWSSARFLSVLVYSCKPFDADAAVAFTRARLGIEGETVHFGF